MTGDAVPQERQAAASRAVSCWSRPYSDNNTEDFVTPSTFASAGPLDIRKGRSGSDLSQQRSRAATGRDGIARRAWGSPVILISSPSWFFIAACGPWMSLALASCRPPREVRPLTRSTVRSGFVLALRGGGGLFSALRRRDRALISPFYSIRTRPAIRSGHELVRPEGFCYGRGRLPGLQPLAPVPG